MTNGKFPLHRLPTNAIINVLRIMDGDQLISYSLISRGTKQNVINLKIKVRFFAVSISSKLEIDLTFSEDYQVSLTFDENQTLNWNPAENEPLRLDNPVNVEVKCYEDYEPEYKGMLILKNRGLSVREWILHLFDIFHHSLIYSLRFTDESNRYDIGFIRETVESLDVDGMGFHRLPLDDCYKFMVETDKFTRRITLDSDLEPVEFLHKVVIQNTKNTMFHSKLLTPEDSIPFRLNDALLNNSENIHMYCTVASDNDLNYFLKLWMKGSNQRLKYMEVGYTFGGEKDQLAIMKDIRHRVMGRDEQRHRPFPIIESRIVVASGGAFVIRRYNGVEATVSFFPRANFMEFVVWD
ncbi:unnamed protein product [Caenorhabditis brenneri]